MNMGTAAVFHLMRAAEYGLHTLANHLSVPIPVYPTWGSALEKITMALEAKRQAAIHTPRGPAKNEELAFCAGLLHTLNYFQAVYRDPVSHASSIRGNFDSVKAQDAFNEVRDLMQRIAKRIGKIG